MRGAFVIGMVMPPGAVVLASRGKPQPAHGVTATFSIIDPQICAPPS